MQEDRSISDQLLWTVAILLGAGIVAVACSLAFWPGRWRAHTPRSHEVPTDIKTRTITVLIKIPLQFNDQHVQLDDEKTSATTNQIAWPSSWSLSNFGGENNLGVAPIESR